MAKVSLRWQTSHEAQKPSLAGLFAGIQYAFALENQKMTEKLPANPQSEAEISCVDTN